MKTMKLKFFLGILFTSIYYVIGYITPIFVQTKIPVLKSDVGSPGLDFFIGITFTLGGIIWLIISILNFYSNRNNLFSKGSMIINMIVFIMIIVSFLYSFLRDN